MKPKTLKDFKIPLPKTQDHRTHWTTLVSTPYTDKQKVEKHIVEVEAKIQGMVKKVAETEGACDLVALGEVCKFQLGKVLSRKNYKDGQVPVIGGGKSPAGFHNEANRPANTILCSASGNSAGYFSRYETPVWASDCFSISSNSNLSEDLLYLILKSYQDDVYKLQYGSAQPHVKPKTLKAFKILIPKDPPSFQTLLQPHFNELDTLRQQVKAHEADYKQAMVELRAAALEE